MGMLVVSKVPVAQLGPPMYSISQGIQLELQSGRTRPDRPCSLYHASMPEQKKLQLLFASTFYVRSKMLHTLA